MAQETKRDRYIWYAKQSGAIKVMSIAYQMYLSLLGRAGAIYTARYSCTFSARASGTRLIRRVCRNATTAYVASPTSTHSAIAAGGT